MLHSYINAFTCSSHTIPFEKSIIHIVLEHSELLLRYFLTLLTAGVAVTMEWLLSKNLCPGKNCGNMFLLKRV